MELRDLQESLRRTYIRRDLHRGADGTFRWLTEEVGELAKAMRTGDRANLEHEFGDVLAWLISLANVQDVWLADAIQRYASGCPRCGSQPCSCEPR